DAKNEQTLIEGTKAGQERDDNGVKMKFVWCPPGKFVMGSPQDEPVRFDSENQVDVVLTRGFWIGRYEVTQGEWAQLKTPLLWKGQEYVKEGDDFPATYLSWENAMAFCRKLTRQERAAGRLPPGSHYTIPTEAQWEYACRAGTTTRFCFGDDEQLLKDYAWFREVVAGLDERYAHAVGQKKPNPWGIHDMYGNVSEWCRDGWQKKLPGGTDPCAVPSDDIRVIRGGHIHFPGVVCKSAYRDGERARDRANMFGGPGLRVVLCPVETKPE
ncbi:MAG TPA: formylglycine-generating enzyme family protein, partial [Planctomycetaceae bacterium]